MSKEPQIEDALDNWLGFNEPPKSKEKAKPGGKLDVKEAVSFLEKGVMSEAQLALGLLGITHHAKQVLDGGLTRDGLLLLLQAKIGKVVKGNYLGLGTIEKVLEAVAALDEFVDRDALERVRAARGKR